MALLWLLGFAARATLLAVPPLIPAMHRDLPLTETAVGALGGLPVLVLSIGALVGSLAVSRLGARRAALAGLGVAALAGAARGIGPSVAWLFGMTIVMAAGVALTQLAIPSLVAAWEARRIGRATAVYGNGILVGEIAGAGLTATLIVGLVSGSWEVALGSWSIAILVIAVVVAVLGPPAEASEVRASWWPEWRDGRVWVAGVTLATASLAYWGANAHLPDYLRTTGHADDVPVALASLNGFQLPASALIGMWPGVFIARRWPLVACGALALAAVTALVLGGGAMNGALAAVLGFVAAFVFVVALALPPLLAAPNDVHRFSAGAFSLGYALAFSGSVIGGALWDATGTAATAFFPIVVAGVLMIVLGLLPVLQLRRA